MYKFQQFQLNSLRLRLCFTGVLFFFFSTQGFAYANSHVDTEINSIGEKYESLSVESDGEENSAFFQNGPSGYINFADLRGVSGNPQFDSMSVCGNCDTIAIFLITNTDSIISDNVLTINLPEGLSYCGSVGSQTTVGVSEANVTDPQSPQFFIPDFNSGNGTQVYFTVKSECEVLSTIFDPVDDALLVDFRIDYTDPSGNDGFDVFFPVRSYNNGVNIPVLNILSTENLTLADVPIMGPLPLPTTYKQKVLVSQNGLGAFLEDFFFEVDYDQAAQTFVSMAVNGIDVSPRVIDNGDILQILLDSIDFATNMNPLSDPAIFEEEEQIMIEVVWDIEFCIDANIITEYNAFYACGGSICMDNTDDSRTATTTVDGNEYSVSLTTQGAHPTTSICSDRTRTLTFNNNSIAASSDVFDIAFEFSTSNLCDVVDATVNGVSVLGGFGTSPIFTFREALDLNDLLTSDPDGPGGLEDIDGDGFYDDLHESSSVSVVFVINSVCDEFDQRTEVSPFCVSTACTYRPSVRPIYRNECQENYIQNVPFAIAWSVQAMSFLNRGVSNFPANLSQNQTFNLDFGVDWNNFFGSPVSRCTNYSLEYILPLPNGIQVNSATWSGAAVPGDSIQITNDTLFINTQGINRTNLVTNTLLRVNMTNLICTNDIIDWEPITYMHCDDDLPDCGCRVPLTNTPETGFCRALESTVRLGCTCPWINTTDYDVSRTSFGYTDKTMSAEVDQNTAGIELDNFLPCDSFALFTEGVVRGGPFDSLMLHIGQNSANFMLESLSAEFEVVDVSTGMTISGACGTITRTRAADEITFQDPFVVRTITGYEINLSLSLIHISEPTRPY